MSSCNNGITAKGFTFNTVPPEAGGTVDRVLMIRALHNLNRFEATAGTRSQAMAAVRGMLKPGGMVGVVQHRLPESAPEVAPAGPPLSSRPAFSLLFFFTPFSPSFPPQPSPRRSLS